MSLPNLEEKYTRNFGLFDGAEKRSVINVETFMCEDWKLKGHVDEVPPRLVEESRTCGVS